YIGSRYRIIRRARFRGVIVSHDPDHQPRSVVRDPAALRFDREIRQYRRPQSGRSGVDVRGRGRPRDQDRLRSEGIQGGGHHAHERKIRSNSHRQRRQHQHSGPARRQVHRPDRRGRRHLSEGQGSNRFHAIRLRARELDRPGAGEFREEFGRGEFRPIECGCARGRGAKSYGENAMRLATTVVLLSLVLTAGARAADTPAAPGAAPSALGPQQVVENSAKRMLTELDANRAMYAKDPAKLDALVANVLLPNFDTEYSARLVLGQTWRTATPDQRK